ncbi:uncharacterized protein LOC129281930 [Lytechinus pictus]|uniref:uncharacterized protein LOC129281930 n=1 Tax=Lytechinus pictus TaxID=7653 RepID=UPI0030B9FDCD
MIAKGLKTFYALTGAGAYTGGLLPQHCATLWRVYCVPRMLFGAAVINFTKGMLKRLNQSQLQLFKQILGLPKSAADEAVHLLTGLIPISAQVDVVKQLIGQLLDLPHERFEYRTFLHALSKQTVTIRAWQTILLKYNLPDLQSLTLDPIPYCQWKKTVKTAVNNVVIQYDSYLKPWRQSKQRKRPHSGPPSTFGTPTTCIPAVAARDFLVALQQVCVTEASIIFSCDFGREVLKKPGQNSCGITSQDWVIYNALTTGGRYGAARSMDDLDGYYVLKRMNGGGRFTLPPLQTQSTKVHLSFFYKFITPGRCGFEVTGGQKVTPFNINITSEVDMWLQVRGVTFTCRTDIQNTCPKIVFKGTCSQNTGVVAVDEIVVESFDDLQTAVDLTSFATSRDIEVTFEKAARSSTSAPNTSTLQLRPTMITNLQTIMTSSPKANTIPYPSVIALAVLLFMMTIVIICLLSKIFSSRRCLLLQYPHLNRGAEFVRTLSDPITRVSNNDTDIVRLVHQAEHNFQDQERHLYITMRARTQRRGAPQERNAGESTDVDDQRTDDDSDEDYVEPDEDLYVNSFWIRHVQSGECVVPRACCETSNLEDLARHGPRRHSTSDLLSHNEPRDKVNDDEFCPNPTYAPFEDMSL